LLCYRCGSPVPDNSETCATCGLRLAGASGAARKRSPGPEAPFRPGDVFAGRYAIRQVLGAGPVGHVFHAHDQEMDVEVALKVINPRLVQMPEERTQFSLALRTGKKLTHPHLVRVYEEGEHAGRPFFTTQLLEGMTLRRMMEQRAAQGQRFTLKEVEPLLGQIATALDSAHRYGPHSDVKPENIIVLPDMLKVTDYGLALGIPRLPFIQAQRSWRTISYVAPEYVEGGELDTRMDLYALGVILGELLTGQTPEEEGELPELSRHAADLPPALESLYRRAVNTNPLVRPKTAGELVAEFTSILSRPRSAQVAAKPAEPAPAPARSRAKPPMAGSETLAALAAATAKESGKAPPPVPTAELPSLATTTVQIQSMTSPSPETTTLVPTAELKPLEKDTPTLELPRSTHPKLPASGGAPTELLPAVGRDLDAPPDATQPIDAETLAALMSGKMQLPPARSPIPPVRQDPKPPPAATVPDRPSARHPAVQRSSMGLVLLIVAGLALGGVGGYLVLWALRKPPATRPATPEPGPVPGAAAAGACPEGMKRVDTFCMDTYEYPNQVGALPQVSVTWKQAKDTCESLGKRLCTEAQWERACAGKDNRRFPYGPLYDAEACNTRDVSGKERALAPAGSFPRCVSAEGIVDLSGNAAEWTDTVFSSSDMTQKGGAFDGAQAESHCTARTRGAPMNSASSLGFRCCGGVQP
jgi:serine/threonine protein kinase